MKSHVITTSESMLQKDYNAWLDDMNVTVVSTCMTTIFNSTIILLITYK